MKLSEVKKQYSAVIVIDNNTEMPGKLAAVSCRLDWVVMRTNVDAGLQFQTSGTRCRSPDVFPSIPYSHLW